MNPQQREEPRHTRNEVLGCASTLFNASRSAPEIEGAVVVPSIEAALERAEGYGRTVFSAGGASVYRQTLPLAEAMYLSYIKGDYPGDAYFPEFDRAEWRVERRQDHPDFEFVVYRRKA